MHLSLLSDAYLSDSLDDSGVLSPRRASDPSHFAALCRGLVVVAALSLPVGFTLFAQAASDNGTVHAESARPPAAKGRG